MDNNNNASNQYGIVLLAAGSSSRLGKAKQLLEYNGITLLSHMVNVATAIKDASVIVVLGANAELMEKELYNQKVFTIRNNEWREGIASSIRCGLNAVQSIEPSCELVLFLPCDQPFVSTSLLKDIMNMYKETGKPIVACNYSDTFGIPALFHKSIFPDLQELKGDTGAKKIILNHRNDQ